MLRSTRKKLQKRNHAKRPATPRLPLQFDGHVVAEIIAAWTGIPLGKMGVGVRPMAALTVARQSFGGPRGWSRTARLGLRLAGSLLPARRSSPAPDRHDPTPIIRRPSGERLADEINTVLNLKPLLKERVIGQDHALEAVAQRVRTARANLEDPNKPKGVFMFVGPSGVGKTETALALADILYGGERKLVTINTPRPASPCAPATACSSPPTADPTPAATTSTAAKPSLKPTTPKASRKASPTSPKNKTPAFKATPPPTNSPPSTASGTPAKS